jgi:7-cyano-7-deazaguanine synthase
MMRRAPIAVLMSGGLDSLVLAGELLASGREVHPIYVRAGFRWERAELHWIRRILRRLKDFGKLAPLCELRIPAAPMVGPSHWSLTGRGVPGKRAAWDSVYLPGRNLVLLGEAGVLCAERGVAELALGVLRGNPFPDATPRFFTLMSRAISAALGRPLKVLAPYRATSKDAVVARGRRLGLPLELAFSCLDPRGLRPCLRCSKCGERLAALRPGPRS